MTRTLASLLGMAAAFCVSAGVPAGGGGNAWPGGESAAQPGAPAARASPPATGRAQNETEPLPARALARFGSAWMHHGAWIRALAFSPDGRLLASGGGQQAQAGTIRLWDASSGRLIRSISAHRYSVTALAFGPDGKVLASAGQDRTVQFWSVATGEAAAGLPSANVAGNCVAFSPDAGPPWLMAVSAGASTAIIDVATGRTVRDLGKGHQFCAFAPTGGQKTLVTLGWDEGRAAVGLWDGPSGREIRRMEAQNERFMAAALSPDGRRLAATSPYGKDAGTITVWEVSTGKVAFRLKGPGPYTLAPAFSPDGRLLAAAAQAGGVTVWDVDTEKAVAALAPSSGQFQAVAFSPDGGQLAAGGGDGQVYLWRTGTFELRQADSSHRGAITSVALSADGNWVLTGGQDGSARLWQAGTGRMVRLLDQRGGQVTCVALSPDPARPYLAAAWSDDTLRLWRIAPVEPLHSLEVRSARGMEIGFADGGRRLVAVGRSGLTASVDCLTGQVAVRQPADDGPDPRWGRGLQEAQGPGGVALSAGADLAASPDRYAIELWETASGVSLGRLSGAGTSYFYAVAIDPAGRLLAGDAGDRLLVFELDSGQVLRQTMLGLRQLGQGALAFSPDGTVLATGHHDGEIALWDLLSGQKLAQRTGHRNRITALRFSADSLRLVSASADGSALLWDIGDVPSPKLPSPAGLDADRLGRLWEALGDADPAKAQEALFALAAEGGAAVAALAERLGAAGPSSAPTHAAEGTLPKSDGGADRGRTQKLIEDMGHDQFAVRQQAFEALRRSAWQAEGALRRAAADSPSQEVRIRARQILEAIDDPPRRSADLVRRLRALRVLEEIGTPPAASALRRIARDLPGTLLHRRAEAALRRLATANPL